MKIILTNDDGIEAPGLNALIWAMPEHAEVVVVAPAHEKSASSHSISLGRELHIEELNEKGIRKFRVHGTPADCIKFAVAELEFKPDLIVSGINQGANTGISVYYSGTISAAREGLINHIPAIAVSLCSRSSRDFRVSSNIVAKLIRGYENELFPRDVLLNVNVPALSPEQIRGLKITKQASSRFVEEFVSENEADGRRTYTLAGEIEVYEKDGTSDEEAVTQGYISLTPLKLDLTDYRAMEDLENWKKKL